MLMRLFSRSRLRPAAGPRQAARRNAILPSLLVLEDRLVPSAMTWPVSSLLDNNSAGTLRVQIANADADLKKNPSNTELVDFTVSGTITLSYTNSITINEGITIDGAGQSVTIQGDISSPNRIFQVSSGTVAINNLTLTNGNAGTNSGGAIEEVASSALTLSNDHFSSNSSGNGGAVYNNGSSTLSVTGCTFASNSSGNGGAVYFAGTGALNVSGCTFMGNAASSEGGAIYLVPAISTTLTNDTFGGTGVGQGNNAASEGGAVFLPKSADPYSTHLTGCTFTDNTVSSNTTAFGGGIYSGANIDVETCTFTGNTAASTSTLAKTTSGGGAIEWVGSSALLPSLTINQDTFNGNSGEAGGGVYVATGNYINVTETIENSTFTNNQAIGSFKYCYGGGLYESNTVAAYFPSIIVMNDTFVGNSSANHGGGLALTGFAYGLNGNQGFHVTSLTITGNTAVTDGGGLYNSGGNSGYAVYMDNTILSGNTVSGNPTGPQNFTGVYGSEAYYCLVGTKDVFLTELNCQASDTPNLAGPANNGGPTQTDAPLTTSLAYENGDPALMGYSDQRGYTRSSFINVTIGAEDPNAYP